MGVTNRPLSATTLSMIRAMLRSLACSSMVACSGPPAPVEPTEPIPVPDTIIEPLAFKDPLVIATSGNEPQRPQNLAAGSCELPLSARLASDCRVIPPLRIQASGELTPPAEAFDGNTCTIWNSGGFAPQSITVDLGAPTSIDAIVLVPEMTPNGPVTHRVELSDDGKTFASAHRIEAALTSGSPVELIMPKRERARFVRVTSDKSPSWIAWREIGLVRCGKIQN